MGEPQRWTELSRIVLFWADDLPNWPKFGGLGEDGLTEVI